MPLDRSWIGQVAVVVLAGGGLAVKQPIDMVTRGLVLGPPAGDGRLVDAYVLGMERPACIVRCVVVAVAGRRGGDGVGTIIVAPEGREPPEPAAIAARLAEAEPPVNLPIVT